MKKFFLRQEIQKNIFRITHFINKVNEGLLKIPTDKIFIFEGNGFKSFAISSFCESENHRILNQNFIDDQEPYYFGRLHY